MSHTKLVLCVFIIFTVIPQGLSIKCWTCRSDFDPKCADPFDNSTIPITDCNYVKPSQSPEIRPTLCRKIKQKVNGEWHHIRDCAYPGEVSDQGNERISFTCDNKDGCNSSPKFVPLPLLLVCLVALPAWLFKVLVQ